MLTKRIIPCLDIKNNRVVKGVNFVDLKDAGDPVEVAKVYNDEGADEIVFLDITATSENKNNAKNLAKKISKNIFIPFTIGGGLRSVDDIKEALDSGADKVSLNSAAIKNPKLISDASEKFGSQAIVVAIDAKYNPKRSAKSKTPKYDVYISGGRIKTKLDALSWAKKVERLGAGEILLTSMDKDGTRDGYDLTLTNMISIAVKIPVIASGGAGKMSDILDVLSDENTSRDNTSNNLNNNTNNNLNKNYKNESNKNKNNKTNKKVITKNNDKNFGNADAALLASLLHYNEIRIKDLKKHLKKNGVLVRG